MRKRFQSVKHLISYVGLSPVLRQSGTSLYQYRGISKQGSAYFRKSLYMPAMTACTQSFLVAYYSKQISRGKKPKVVIVSAMRKLLTYAYVLVKNDCFFDVKKFNKNT